MSYLPPIVSAATTLMIILLLLRFKSHFINDIPNERSLHDVPTPRTGGVAFMLGIAGGWSFIAQYLPWWLLLPLLGLFTMSLIDDLCGLSARIRLIGHFIAALLVSYGFGVPWLWLLPALLFFVWMTNLYNFMDGSDGLAGGMALFGFGAYGIAALMSGNDQIAMMTMSIASATMVFLVFNFHPARIFMGDAGSIPLGFLAACFGVWGWLQFCWPAWFPFLVFSPFVVDATVTMLNRLRKGERITQPHRSHYYQRLVRNGWGHRKLALIAYLLMFVSGISALWGMRQEVDTQAGIVMISIAAYLGMLLMADSHCKKIEGMQKNVG